MYCPVHLVTFPFFCFYGSLQDKEKLTKMILLHFIVRA
jgi:hypothetical protein